MNPIRLFQLAIASTAVFVMANCASQTQVAQADPGPVQPVNPHPPGTYAHFKAEPSYPKTHSVWTDRELLARTDASNSHLVINLKTQRGFLMNGQEVVIDYPICSGRRSHPTPPGTFQITEKIVDKSSNRYGRIYNADGKLVNSDADSRKDAVPPGGKFVGAPMPYWMRLTSDGIGHHVGPVKRYPASHACIRGPKATMPVVYSKVKTGTKVVVVD
jgi:hypothetical protein